MKTGFKRVGSKGRESEESLRARAVEIRDEVVARQLAEIPEDYRAFCEEHFRAESEKEDGKSSENPS